MEQGEQEAVAARVAQLQAPQLPSALHGLLGQAAKLLKPPARGACQPPAPPATRHSLVAGLLLTLERAALLAAQHRDAKLLKDAQAQLVAAFQEHGWLWELLLRKHLASLLQQPAAARLFVGALGCLPGSTQARAFGLWSQLLQAQPQMLAVPIVVQQALLQQLRLFFHASPAAGLTALLDDASEQPEPSSGAAVAAAAAVTGAASQAPEPAAGAVADAEVSIALREQLPHLLQLLLLLTCGSGSEASATGGLHQGGSSGRGSGNAPSLSSVQSEVVGRRAPVSRDGAGEAAAAAAAAPQASGSAAEEPAPANTAPGSSGEGVQEAVLRRAVLLVSRLSDPDALHDLLGIQMRSTAGRRSGSGSGGSSDEEDAAEQAAAQPDRQQYVLGRRDAGRVRTAAALLEVCLDGILTLPPLAAAVHQQLCSKGNSSAAAGAAAEEQQRAAAAAELRHTAGVMLGMHRELSRFHGEQRQQQHGSSPALRPASAAPLLSLAACEPLLHVLAEVRQQPEQPEASNPEQQQPQQQAGGSGTSAKRKTPKPRGLEVGHAQGPPALLLVPPQLAAQGLDLIRRAIAAAGAAASRPPASWRTDLAAKVAALYAACYQALWGAKVLQSAEAYQLLLSAARLRMLLRSGAAAGQAGPASTAADDEAAAEAALVMQHAVGSRRRQRSAAHELPGLAVAMGAGPAAKRLKTESGGAAVAGGSIGGSGNDAVAELLQLFQPAAPQQQQQQQQQDAQLAQAEGGSQQQAPARKRITAVAIKRDEQPAAEPQQQAAVPPARRRIVPEQVAPASAAAAGRISRPASAAAGPAEQCGEAADPAAQQQQQQQQQSSPAEAAAAEGAQPLAPPAGMHQQQQQQQQQQPRPRISKAADLSEEQQEAMWAAYIADKEFLVEMLGDANYQQWYDEAAHPLRKQRQRPGGLEAAWAAVLGGGGTGASIVRQQLPRSLLEASSSMPWDATAAACLQLLAALLAGAAGSAAVEGEQGPQQLLQRAFSSELREVGALAAAQRALLNTATGTIARASKAAAAAPAGGVLVLLAVQALGLAQGRNYFSKHSLEGERQRGSATPGAAEEDQAAGGRLVAPPLLEAYSELLGALLPLAQAEAVEADPAGPGKQLQHGWLLLWLAAELVRRLLRLPPPLHHMLSPGCAALLPVAAADADATAVAQRHAALLWMLVQQEQAGGSGGVAEVVLPSDCPAWLATEAHELEHSSPRELASQGHALLLGPLREVQQAAALELLRQLRRCLDQQQQQQQQQQPGGSSSKAAGAGLDAEALLPLADACQAVVQLLLAERQRQRQQQDGSSSGADSEDDEEEVALAPLLLGSPVAVAEAAGLVTALCQVGAAAGAALAAAFDGAAGEGGGQQQRQSQAQQQQAQQQQEYAAPAAAAGVLVLCDQLGGVADQLLEAGCLPPAAEQALDAARLELEGQLQAAEQLALLLPRYHPLSAAVAAAMAGAPALWQPQEGSAEEVEEVSGDEEGGRRAAPAGSKQQRRPVSGKGGGKAAKPRAQQQGQRRRRRLKDVRNPAVRAMLAEDGVGELDADDLSDLEDFIVCNPERDYTSFFRHHFYQDRGSDSEDEQQQQRREEEQKEGGVEGGRTGSAEACSEPGSREGGKQGSHAQQRRKNMQQRSAGGSKAKKG